MRWQLVTGCLALVTVTGCDYPFEVDLFGPSPPEEPRFELYVRVRTTGDALDTGYLLTISEVVSGDSVVVLSEVGYKVGQNYQRFSYPAPRAGAIMNVLVSLGDVAFNCTVAGPNPVETQLEAGVWHNLGFNVTCVRPPLP